MLPLHHLEIVCVKLILVLLSPEPDDGDEDVSDKRGAMIEIAGHCYARNASSANPIVDSKSNGRSSPASERTVCVRVRGIVNTMLVRRMGKAASASSPGL